MKMNRRRSGFTIIELVAVAMIIALLAAFVVPRAFKGLGKAKRDIALGKIGILEKAIAQFEYECGRLPMDGDGLDELVLAPAELEEKWGGPYCKKSDLNDPWGNPFQYIQEGMHNIGTYDLYSFGADGAEGGEGDNEDIFNE